MGSTFVLLLLPHSTFLFYERQPNLQHRQLLFMKLYFPGLFSFYTFKNSLFFDLSLSSWLMNKTLNRNNGTLLADSVGSCFITVRGVQCSYICLMAKFGLDAVVMLLRFEILTVFLMKRMEQVGITRSKIYFWIEIDFWYLPYYSDWFCRQKLVIKLDIFIAPSNFGQIEASQLFEVFKCEHNHPIAVPTPEALSH